ncbi:MAG: hypothetical protein KGH94_02045 [Candidatus Micrarchaeota archaeon]|nr:hypothetical protein [Candidatus Micrarchaeota archaeon]
MELGSSSKGIMFTLVTVVIVVLLLGEVLTYLYTNTQYSNLGIQATPSLASTSLYSQVKIGAPAFLQISLSKAIYALNAYETGYGYQQINNGAYALQSLMTNGTLYGTSMSSYMGGYTLLSYSNSLATQGVVEGLTVSLTGSNVIVFQNTSGSISATMDTSLNVSSPYGTVSYPITANASIPLSGLPDLYGGSLGTGAMTYSNNVSRLVNASYAALLSTGSIYNSVAFAGGSSAEKQSLSPYMFVYAPLFVDSSNSPSCTDNSIASVASPSNYILVAANSQNINSNFCGFAGMISYYLNPFGSAPTKPALIYGYSAGTYVNITLTNSQSSSVATNFQQMIYFNPTNTAYTPYEASDLGNIRFYQGSNQLYSWCESGCNTISSTNAVFWVKVPSFSNIKVPVTLTNSNSVSGTGNSFQQQIFFNPQNTLYLSNEANDLGNIRFYQGTQELYSWCESGCNTISSTNAIFWVLLPSGIPASNSVIVNMTFLSSNVEYDGIYAGEAPQLSGTYGQYDNGNKIFNLYQNFYGTSVPAGWGAYGGSTVTVNNGVSISGGGAWEGVKTTSSVLSANQVMETLLKSPGIYSGIDAYTTTGANSNPFGYVAGEFRYQDSPSRWGLESSSPSSLQTYGGTSAINTWYVVSVPYISGNVPLLVNYTQIITSTFAVTPTAAPLALMIYPAGAGPGFFQWTRIRAYPPGGVMPSQSFGSVQPQQTVITMAFGPTSGDYDAVYAGEAPQLTCTNPSNTITGCSAGQYAKFDNGPSVFSLYDNFTGPSLRSVWNPTGNVIASNGLAITTTSSSPASSGIVSASTLQYPYMFEGLVTYRYAGGPAALGGVEESIGNTIVSGSQTYNSGYTIGMGSSNNEKYGIVNFGGTETVTTITTTTLPTIFGVAWVNTGNVVFEYASTGGSQYQTVSVSNSLNTVGPLYSGVVMIGAISGFVAGVQYVRARAYPPNDVMPSFTFNSVQTGSALTISNIIAYLNTGNTYLLSGNALSLYDTSPLQTNVYKGAYIPSAFSPSYLNLMSGIQYTTSPYGVAPLGVATRQVTSFSGGNVIASSVKVNTQSGGYNTASFWIQWPTSQSNLVPFSFNSYSIYVTGTGIGFSSGSGDLLGTQIYGLSTFSTTPWVHVVAIFKNGVPAAASDILYINGVRENLQVLQGTPATAGAGSTISIGGFPSTPNYNTFRGSIADLQVYNAVLTPYQVYSLYASGINSAPVNYSSLVGWWPLNGNLNDYSQYHNNGLSNNGIVSYSNLAGYYGSSLDGGSFYHTPVAGVQGISQCYGVASCYWDTSGKLYTPTVQSYATLSVQLPSSVLGLSNGTIPGSAYFNWPQNSIFVASGISSGSVDTVSFWMDWIPNGNTVSPLYFSGLGLSGSSGSGFGLNSGGTTCGVSASSVSNRWVNIVAVLNSGGGGSLYVNGSQVQTCSLSGSLGSTVYIGGQNGAVNPFSGSISDVQVYNSALTSTQIGQLYLNNTVPGVTPTAWWPLNSGYNGFTNQTGFITGTYAVEYQGSTLCREANSLGLGSSCGIIFLPFGPK